MIRQMRSTAAALAMLALSGCTFGDLLGNTSKNADILQGPPIEDIVTPFDTALECLKPKINREVRYAVGVVADQTGRQSYGESGSGAYFTQGAGEMIQTAILRSGATLVNRRNLDIPVSEARWGIRALDTQVPVNFFISGSINSLDFIPGGGFAATFSGVGPRYRQNRILIGADLYLTDARTGVVIGGVPVQKQVLATELGFSVGRFAGSTLLNVDAGVVEREALNFVLRQMLSLATFELISLTMEPRHWLPCRAKLDAAFGKLTNTKGAEIETLVMAELERLRKEDPEAAKILERELAGESIEDIMKSLGKPIKKSKPKQPEPAAAKPAAPPAAAQAPAVPPPPTVARTKGPLRVEIIEADTATRVTVAAPIGADLRWGFRGPNLLVVAMAHDGGFDLSNVSSGLNSQRLAGLRVGGEGFRQVLQIRLKCNDCGAAGIVSDEGALLLDIATGEERTLIDLSDNPSAGAVQGASPAPGQLPAAAANSLAPPVLETAVPTENGGGARAAPPQGGAAGTPPPGMGDGQ